MLGPHLCIEIDFLKPVVSKVFVDDILFNVEYEKFSYICFNCGQTGHKLDTCSSYTGPVGHNTQAHTVTFSLDQPEPVNHLSGSVKGPQHGPWLIVARR
ncbi:hypothetical protein LguiB_033683 [Lonicera macranthoides]